MNLFFSPYKFKYKRLQDLFTYSFLSNLTKKKRISVDENICPSENQI